MFSNLSKCSAAILLIKQPMLGQISKKQVLELICRANGERQAFQKWVSLLEELGDVRYI